MPSDAQEIDIQVQNSGDSDETGISVSATLAGTDLTGQLQALSAGETGTVKIPLTSKPTPGTDATLQVVVQPVPGEQLTDNNQSTYTVIFGSIAVRIAYLGPRGTFSEDALRAAVGDEEVEAVPAPSVYDAIVAVREGAAERALVPFENSIEGAVTATLDTLAFDAGGVTLVGEYDLPIRHCLIARERVEPDAIEVVLSHPQPSAQCARFIRENLPQAEVRAAPSTAEAVRTVVETEEPWAALGAESAADLYGAAVLREGIEDERDNITRFVWVAPEGTRPSGSGPWRTSLVFSELGEDHPGALVDALQVFSDRDVNLTRIESRPLRRGLGRYQFFLDIEGAAEEEPLTGAIDALRSKAETVRVLGSWPIEAPPGVPGAG